MVVRRSRRGKTFYGCTNYPKCDFTVWDKPIQKECPKCGAPFVLEKNTKKGLVHYCYNQECGYRETMAAPASEEMPRRTEHSVEA
jgi:DNA topoisomerase-1